MRKITIIAALLVLGQGSALAWENTDSKGFDRGVFNRVSLNVSAGTEGVGIGVATPVTNFLELEAGVSMMPGFKLKGDFDVEQQTIAVSGGSAGYIVTPEATVNAEGSFSRTTFNFKAHAYPFGGGSKFFVTAGFSFGGARIAKISGRSDEIEEFINRPENAPYRRQILDQIGATVGEYNVKFNDDLNLAGDVRCNGFRPYLGLGCGRLVSKKRVGFRVEAGCQFMGKLKVYQDGAEIDFKEAMHDAGSDDISKFVGNWRVYPVLKFTVVGRIL